MSNKAVFIDKDGTLIPDIPYNVDPSKIILFEGAAKSLRDLKACGYLLIVVTNQSGVAHGYFEESALNAVKETIQQQLGQEGTSLDAMYYCPHHPEGRIAEYALACNCRKPKAGMLVNAAQNFDIDLSRSWMVGDILNDVEAGNTAGCRTILIDNGNETEWRLSINRLPSRIEPGIRQAANFIMNIEL
jgi:D,D-heptose 1,7-bisphosphate phosphatase